MFRLSAILVVLSLVQVFCVPLQNTNYDETKTLLDAFEAHVKTFTDSLEEMKSDADNQVKTYIDNFRTETFGVMTEEFVKLNADYDKLREKAQGKGGNATECIAMTEEDMKNLPAEFEESTNFCLTLSRTYGFDALLERIQTNSIDFLNRKVPRYEAQLKNCQEDDECLATLRKHINLAMDNLKPNSFDFLVEEVEEEVYQTEHYIYTKCYLVGIKIRYVNDIIKSVDECIDEASL